MKNQNTDYLLLFFLLLCHLYKAEFKKDNLLFFYLYLSIFAL